MKYSICLDEGSTAAGNTSVKAHMQREGATNIETWEHLPCTLFADLPNRTIRQLTGYPGISAIEAETPAPKVPMIEVIPMVEDNPWGLRAHGFPALHGRSIMGQGIIVAYLDTGVSIHEDLTTSGGINFVEVGQPPTDRHKHGTHVCGILSANLNTIGTTGGAPLASIYVIKVLDDRGSGPWPRIMDGVNHLIGLTNGGRNLVVSNHSYGGTTDPGAAVAAAFKAAADAGVDLVCSAGNSGEGVNTVGWPAQLPDCMAVASVDESLNWSDFSSTGPTVEIAGAGGRIYSTLLNNAYGYLSGTSMASPYVAAAIAIARQNGVADPRSIFHKSTNRTGRDRFLGYGFLDVVALANGGHTVPQPPLEPTPPPEGPPPIDTLPVYKQLTGPRISFDGAASNDPDGRVVGWQWYTHLSNTWSAVSNQPRYGISYGLSTPDLDEMMGLRVYDDKGLRSPALWLRYQVDMPDDPDSIPPTAPTDFKVIVDSSTSVTITWGPATDNILVAGYQIFRQRGRDEFRLIVSTSRNLFKWVDNRTDEFWKLAPNTTYTYKMNAHDVKKNRSPFTESIIVTTPATGQPPLPPTDPIPPPDPPDPPPTPPGENQPPVADFDITETP